MIRFQLSLRLLAAEAMLIFAFSDVTLALIPDIELVNFLEPHSAMSHRCVPLVLVGFIILYVFIHKGNETYPLNH